MKQIVRMCKAGMYCGVLLSVAPVSAIEGVSFQPRAVVGYGDYSLEAGRFDVDFLDDAGNVIAQQQGVLALDLNTSKSDSNKISIKAPMIGLGATVAFNNFYVDAYYQTLLRDQNGSSCIDVTFAGEVECEGRAPASPEFRADFSDVRGKRDEYSVSVGYQFLERYSVFAGYRDGDMEWDQTRQDSDAFKIEMDGSFELDGPFIGAAFSLPIEDAGALTVKLAYADLDGELSTSETTSFPTGSRVVSYTGTSDAVSLGVAFTGAVSEQMGYSVGVDFHKFDFDMDDGKFSSNGVPLTLDFRKGSLEEQMVAFKLSMIYVF